MHILFKPAVHIYLTFKCPLDTRTCA